MLVLIVNYIMLQCQIFLLSMNKVTKLNNEINKYKSNPCEQKAQVSDCSGY